MTIMLWITLGVLALKMIWNLGVPYVLLKQLWSTCESKTSGMSMFFAIEIVLLLVAIGLSAASAGQSWVNRPLAVTGWGIAAIAFTYIHLVIVGALGAWLMTWNGRSSGNWPPQGPSK